MLYFSDENDEDDEEKKLCCSLHCKAMTPSSHLLKILKPNIKSL